MRKSLLFIIILVFSIGLFSLAAQEEAEPWPDAYAALLRAYMQYQNVSAERWDLIILDGYSLVTEISASIISLSPQDSGGTVWHLDGVEVSEAEFYRITNSLLENWDEWWNNSWPYDITEANIQNIVLSLPPAKTGQFTYEDMHPVGVRWLVEPTWDFDIVVNFRGGMAAVEFYDDDWMHVLGYVNNKGEIVIPLQYRHWPPHYFYRGAPHFEYGAAGIFSADHDYLVAFFNSYGEQITPFMFAEARNFSGGFAAAATGTWVEGLTWGFVDTNGSIAIPFEFSHTGYFAEGLAAVLRDGYWGFINKSGDVVIPFMTEFFWYWPGSIDQITVPIFSEGRALVWEIDWSGVPEEWRYYLDSQPSRLMGFIDMEGNQITSFMYDRARGFSNGRAAVSVGNWITEEYSVWGFIDLYGNEVVPLMYDWVHDFSEGLAAVQYGSTRNAWGTSGDGLWGFIDMHGNVVVPLIYNMVRSFSGGFAAVQSSSGWGFIDHEGNEAVPTIYTWVGDFSYGLAVVSSGGRIGHDILWYNEQDRRFGVIDNRGNIVVPLVLDEIRDFSEGLAWVRQGDYWGLLQIVMGEDAMDIAPLYIPNGECIPEDAPEPATTFPYEPTTIPEPMTTMPPLNEPEQTMPYTQAEPIFRIRHELLVASMVVVAFVLVLTYILKKYKKH